MKFSEEELREVIKENLEMDQKMGVPIDGQAYMLARWVVGIIQLEVEEVLRKGAREA